METYIQKMKEIIEQHYVSKGEAIKPDSIRLNFFKELNGNIECEFIVPAIPYSLFRIIYFLDYNEYRVFLYKLSNIYDVD